MIMTRPGLAWVDVVNRWPVPETFSSGAYTVNDGWLDLVGRMGYCVLIIGAVGLAQDPEMANDQARVTEMVARAADVGLVTAALVPVYLPAKRPGEGVLVWPGRVEYRKPPPGRRVRAKPLGLSIGLDESDEVGEAAAVVRSMARGKSYEWVRQQLSVQLLLRGHLKPPVMTDQVAQGVARLGLPGAVHRAGQAARRSLITNSLAIRTVVAYALRRRIPHWHIYGTHVMRTWPEGPQLEVALDPWADELLAVGDGDEMEIMLGAPRDSTGEAGVTVAYRGDYRIGTLGDDLGAYGEILAEPRHENVWLVTDGVRSLAPDGSRRLRVLAPVTANSAFHAAIGQLTTRPR
jgi:hypothetical protein